MSSFCKCSIDILCSQTGGFFTSKLPVLLHLIPKEISAALSQTVHVVEASRGHTYYVTAHVWCLMWCSVLNAYMCVYEERIQKTEDRRTNRQCQCGNHTHRNLCWGGSSKDFRWTGAWSWRSVWRAAWLSWWTQVETHRWLKKKHKYLRKAMLFVSVTCSNGIL